MEELQGLRSGISLKFIVARNVIIDARGLNFPKKAVVEKDLDKLLQQARDENPLNEPIKPSDDEANKK